MAGPFGFGSVIGGELGFPIRARDNGAQLELSRRLLPDFLAAERSLNRRLAREKAARGR